MPNKRLFILLGIAILLLGMAAFAAGRMLNGNVGSVSPGGPNAGGVSISLDDITPAPELPITKADVTGQFVERKDNILTVQTVSFGPGVGAVSRDSPMNEASGTSVEVVVTGTTKVYQDVTQFPAPVNGEIHNVQQAAAEGTLDDLNSQTFITVWGRSSGDRIIAETVFYSNPWTIKKPGS